MKHLQTNRQKKLTKCFVVAAILYRVYWKRIDKKVRLREKNLSALCHSLLWSSNKTSGQMSFHRLFLASAPTYKYERDKTWCPFSPTWILQPVGIAKSRRGERANFQTLGKTFSARAINLLWTIVERAVTTQQSFSNSEKGKFPLSRYTSLLQSNARLAALQRGARTARGPPSDRRNNLSLSIPPAVAHSW